MTKLCPFCGYYDDALAVAGAEQVRRPSSAEPVPPSPSPSDEVIEAVAQAIHEEDRNAFGAYSWEALDDKSERGWYRDVASAAIAAYQKAISSSPSLLEEAMEIARVIDQWATNNITEWNRAASPLENEILPNDVILLARAMLSRCRATPGQG